jgi:hypothetical protein
MTALVQDLATRRPVIHCTAGLRLEGIARQNNPPCLYGQRAADCLATLARARRAWRRP